MPMDAHLTWKDRKTMQDFRFFSDQAQSWLRRPKSAGALGPTAQEPERFLRRPGGANRGWRSHLPWVWSQILYALGWLNTKHVSK